MILVCFFVICFVFGILPFLSRTLLLSLFAITTILLHFIVRLTMKRTNTNSLMLPVQFFVRCGNKISWNRQLIRCTITTQSVKLHYFIRSDERLTLESSAFQIFQGGNSTFINSFHKTKFNRCLDKFSSARVRSWD